MRGYQVDLGLGMRPSFFDIFHTLAFTMSITFAALGLLNLAAASSPDTSRALLRRITWVNIFWVAGFSVLCLIYQVLPPLIFGVLIWGILVVSLASDRIGRVTAPPLKDRSAAQ